MKFWDTSALVPLAIEEPTTPAMVDLLTADPVAVVWMMTSVELLSTVSRLGRQVPELADLLPAMRVELMDLFKTWASVTLVEEVRRRAERLVGVHPVSAADAVQLAAALVAAGDRPESLEFVTLDHPLARAARLEGFRVLPSAPSPTAAT